MYGGQFDCFYCTFVPNVGILWGRSHRRCPCGVWERRLFWRSDVQSRSTTLESMSVPGRLAGVDGVLYIPTTSLSSRAVTEETHHAGYT